MRGKVGVLALAMVVLGTGFAEAKDKVRHAKHAKEGSKKSTSPALSLAAESAPEAKAETKASPKANAKTSKKVSAKTAKRGHAKKTASRHEAKACFEPAITIQMGHDQERVPLATCKGEVNARAEYVLSVLSRPSGLALPKSFANWRTEPIKDLALPTSIKRISHGLVDRLARVVKHFTKKSDSPKLVVMSAYRPKSAGSFHAHARAIDFRLDGIRNEDIVAFCKSLPDTGCGYYPNSAFVHLDERDPGVGHVSWIDASGPGEEPKYVSDWPTHGSQKDILHDEVAEEDASLLAPLNSD